MNLASSTVPRIPRPSIELTVLGARRLSDQLVRVRLGGDGFAQFEDRPETDKYVKLQFPTPGDALRPTTRTYTIRRVDHEAGALEIDFVVHGDEGLAGPWAASVHEGDTVRLLGPGGGYAPNADADWHLLVGDLSALPAIAAAIDALPATASGIAIIEVTDAEAVIEIEAPSGIEVQWIIDPDHATGALADAVRTLTLPEGLVDVFAHGERESMKALRHVLFEELGLPRGQVSLSGYWARGRTEDRFQAEKREPIGRIDPVG